MSGREAALKYRLILSYTKYAAGETLANELTKYSIELEKKYSDCGTVNGIYSLERLSSLYLAKRN